MVLTRKQRPMFPPPTPAPTNPRSPGRVLLGAAALASVALLSGCSLWPKAWTSQPAPAETATAPQPAPTPAPSADASPGSTPPVPAAIPQGNAAPQPLQTAQATPTPAPAAVPPAAAAPTPAAVATRPRLSAADLPRGYYINVGLFAVPDNGINAHRKLENAGLPALSDSVTTRKGELTRVRVGPFPTRAQADAAAKKILGLKLEAVVFRH